MIDSTLICKTIIKKLFLRSVWLILLALVLFEVKVVAQTYPYQETWKKIEQREKNGELKSLLPLVNQIYLQAKKDKQPQHKIRALFYHSKITLLTQDNKQQETELFNRFKSDIKTAQPLEKSILQSYLAGLLFEYYQSNRYKIDQRTNGNIGSSDDFFTWNHTVFIKEIDALYDASLRQSALLIQESAENWVSILDTSVRERSLKPTLYDLLIHRSLNLYASPNGDVELNKKGDSLVQRLVDQHRIDGNENAFLYNSLLKIKRQKDKKGGMGFPLDEIVISKYIEELKALSKLYPKAWYTSEILLTLALAYQQSFPRVQNLVPFNSQHYPNQFDISERKKELQDSILLLNDIVQSIYANTHAGKQLKEIAQRIVSPEFSLEIADVNLPEQAIPMRIVHKNMDKVYVKVLLRERTISDFTKVDATDIRSLKSNQDIDSVLREHENIQSFSVDLERFNDYEPRSTIIKIDPLQNGEYLVLASNNEAFQIDDDNIVVIQSLIQVSQYALVRKENQLLIIDRENGHPIKDKKISIYRTATNIEDLELVQDVTTNQGGIAEIAKDNSYPNKEEDRAVVYRIDGDRVFIESKLPRNFPRTAQAQEKLIHTSFFIDRGIYRPGQTVYFKGILYNQDVKDRRVLANSKMTVHLYDPNNKIIESVELTSNEYGSIFGSFILPVDRLTGNFSIQTNDRRSGEIYFRVEEYKRPTFEILLDTVKGNPRIGDVVVAKGKIQAFSGAAINQAKIQYRINREDYIPYFARYNNRSNETIASGEINVDKDGRFEVKFVAKPKEEKRPEQFRFYNYLVDITAVDINGETHSAQKRISVGDKSMILTIPLRDEVNIDYLDSIPYKVNNLNGQAISANGHIRLTKLNAPKRVLVNDIFSNYSRIATYMLQDSLSFVKLFPHLPYDEENYTSKWPRGKVVLDENFSSSVNSSIATGNRKGWEEGFYELEAYVLDGTDTLRIKEYINLYHSDRKKPVDHEFLGVYLGKPSYKIGESAEVFFSSAAKNAVVLVEVEHNGKLLKSEQIELNNNVYKLRLPIDETMSGQILVHYYMGKYNTAKQSYIRIPIEVESPELVITTSTFRDKLVPGQEEVWELKISDSQKDTPVAEVLALMYDASLNQFAKNNIDFSPISFKGFTVFQRWDSYNAYKSSRFIRLMAASPYNNIPPLRFEDLNNFGLGFYNFSGKQQAYITRLNGYNSDTMLGGNLQSLNEVVVVGYGKSKRHALTGSVAGVNVNNARGMGGEFLIRGTSTIPGNQDQMISEEMDTEEKVLSEIAARKNLSETAFFFPDLKTDEEGNVKIRFTTPESLTEWTFMALAHTPDLKTGSIERSTRTRKELMAVPNVPRFLRAGDEFILSSKIVNLSEGALTGSAKLMLFDAFTMKPIDSLFSNIESEKGFSVQKGNSSAVEWQLKVPAEHSAVVYRVVAAAGNFSDGEEAALPILPSKELITETLSFYAKEGQQKQFNLEGLKNSGANYPDHVGLSLEITSNPFWYAIQALPYLNESSYESSDHLFAKLYSSLVSKQLIETSPKIKAVFDDLNTKDLLKSKLTLNQEFKAILLEETPWIRIAENEEDRMKRLAILFDLNNNRNNRQSIIDKLNSKQLNSGAFSWFDGGDANRRITTNMVIGFGKLKTLKNEDLDFNKTLNKITARAINYIDNEALGYSKALADKESRASYDMIHYLYARSYFLKEYPVNDTVNKVISLVLQKLEGNSQSQSLQAKAMLAIAYNRFDRKEKAIALLKSLKEYSVQADEMGMYWKENVSGWDWWQSPIETQAVLIEAFQEVINDKDAVEQMKVWLIKNRQTNHWRSTKATTSAISAILFTGNNWLASEGGVEVKLGGKVFDMEGETSNAGYTRTTWEKTEIKPEMGTIEIKKTSPGVLWGAMYWQHFQELDQVKASAAGVELEKTLFVKKNTDQGIVLVPIRSNTPIKIGDLVTVRIVIRADRDFQFMHLKDMRASGIEPVNTLSGYKWKDGMGYYESTRDASTHFFIDRMTKGTYVFEYDLRANSVGDFSNGITTLQSMFAPEMNAKTEGTQVKIRK